MPDTALAAEAPRRFLDVAARLFARDGYHAVSMRDIARALGVTPGAVYAHFPSKASVLAAVYADGVERIAAAVDAAIGGAEDPWERLEHACRGHLEAVLDAEAGYGSVVTRVLPGEVPGSDDQLVALRDGYEARFRALVAELPLRAGTDRTLFRMTLLGALNWTPVWHGGRGADAGEVARQLVATLRTGAEEERR
ncbi:MAG TPA: TetR/AcrR family transcriptional regulator [Thermohalobaculum sp.]|nr:TetR/AcrR family transcriptional regulator [Thermohalobaculum sp.]